MHACIHSVDRSIARDAPSKCDRIERDHDAQESQLIDAESRWGPTAIWAGEVSLHLVWICASERAQTDGQPKRSGPARPPRAH